MAEWTLKQIMPADVLGLTRQSVQTRINNGTLYSQRHGRGWAIPVIRDQDSKSLFVTEGKKKDIPGRFTAEMNQSGRGDA